MSSSKKCQSDIDYDYEWKWNYYDYAKYEDLTVLRCDQMENDNIDMHLVLIANSSRNREISIDVCQASIVCIAKVTASTFDALSSFV